jgi:hypothetical protein
MSLAPTGAKMRARALSRVMAGLVPATHDFATFVPAIVDTQAPS